MLSSVAKAEGGYMTFTRRRLWQLLGDQAEPPPQIVSTDTESRYGYGIERLRLRMQSGETVRGIVTRPASGAERLPAILYLHSHGGHYEVGADELLNGQDYIGALGPVFAVAGYVTLCIDMPLFGQRRQFTESALSKALLWRGKTLMGQMLAELSGALGYLADRPDVDAGRIGGFGMSMGCTHAFMLAALDDRLKAVAHLCCFADYELMIRSGAHEGHGHYMTIPGLVAEMSTGEICGAVAPRPQLICIGEADVLTPPDAVAQARLETEAAYRHAGCPEQLEIFTEPGIGHQETPAMREKVLAFFSRTL
jgi:dienelactone hydrolase